MTRSPTLRSLTPLPTLSITPATSAAGEKGKGGLIWYLPWIIKRSKKFSAADLIAITASPGPATGSGTSVSTRSSGPQYCEQRMAFMDTLDLSERCFDAANFVIAGAAKQSRTYSQGFWIASSLCCSQRPAGG